MRTSTRYLDQSYNKILKNIKPNIPLEDIKLPIKEKNRYAQQLIFSKKYYEKNKDKIIKRHKENYYKKDKSELARKNVIYYLNNDEKYHKKIKQDTINKYHIIEDPEGTWK